MMNLICQLLDAKTQREVDSIVTKNIFDLPSNQRSKLTIFANNAKRRINRIDREKRKSFADLLN